MDLCNQLRIDSASEMDEYSVYALNDKGESAVCAEVCCVCKSIQWRQKIYPVVT